MREAGVAQLAEHDVANVVVVGSNPITRSCEGNSRTPKVGLGSRMVAPNSDELLSTPDGDEPTGSQDREAIDETASSTAPADADLPESDDVAPEEATEAKQKRNIEVDVQVVSDCERHIVVSIPPEEIEQCVQQELDGLKDTAALPGFRPGHVPQRLLEVRLRKDKAFRDQVRTTLVVDALEQVNEERSLTPISEPDFDLEAIDLPEEGPLTFEFDLEVRPDFELPDWRGLKLSKPVVEIDDALIYRMLERVLSRQGQLLPVDRPAESGDYIEAELTFEVDGSVLSRSERERIRLRSTLNFEDGRIEDFDKALAGVQAGETRTCTAVIDAESDSPYAGREVTARFHVHEVKRLDLPDLSPDFLEETFGVSSMEALRESIHQMLNARIEHQARSSIRRQITETLLESADWELPPKLLRKQTERELYRSLLDLQASGYSQEDIRAHLNTLRREAASQVSAAMREHFILERLAEELEIDATEADFDMEIFRIAEQNKESPRRVRARLEKEGQIDILRNRIIENKVIERILEEAEVEPKPTDPEELLVDTDAETVDVPIAPLEDSGQVKETAEESMPDETQDDSKSENSEEG